MHWPRDGRDYQGQTAVQRCVPASGPYAEYPATSPMGFNGAYYYMRACYGF